MAHSKVLFLTNSELGEANVCLATALGLIETDPSVEVHIASFPALKSAVRETCQMAGRLVPQHRPFVFHELRGVTMTEGMAGCMPGVSSGQYLSPAFEMAPGLRNTPKSLRAMPVVDLPWDGPQAVEIFESIKKILEDVRPHVTAVNSLFGPGMSTCSHLKVKYVVLSPNSLKDFAAVLQPYGAVFWKYPCLGSAMPFPVPWYLIPLNFFFGLYGLLVCFMDPRRRSVIKYFREKTGAKLITSLTVAVNFPAGPKLLVGCRRELDYPLTNLPAWMVPCGPIILPAMPGPSPDPELMMWLGKSPTVVINLGSHAVVTEGEAAQMASAIKILLRRAGETSPSSPLQVLWKLKKKAEFPITGPDSEINHILEKEMANGRVKIVDWIAIPNIVATGQVVCSVHHGGANSFYEAICAGVPQIVLPQWVDCYDYASRAELLGVGLCGNKTMRPKWSAEELSAALESVILGNEGKEMKREVRKLALVCQENGGGRMVAARALLAEAMSD